MIKLLVVDDEDMIRDNLEAYLEDEGFEVIAAESGERAVELLKEEDEGPSLGVIDMRLPGIDGNEVITQAHKIWPEMLFIVHTGSSEYSLPEHLLSIGLTENNILFKPLPDMETLLGRIGEFIDISDR
jgi:DNA-binding NtrC family response regulator